MGEFYSDLKSILGPRMLWEVVLGMRRNDLLGLAGQLAYFFLLFFCSSGSRGRVHRDGVAVRLRWSFKLLRGEPG